MKVLVLMSVYNGEKYIKEQIDSILAQENVSVSVLIRDDGSKDSSVEILEEYAAQHDNINWYQGKNAGAWKSFMELICEAGTDFDYYAFADQDDVWLPEKLWAAVKILEEMKEKYGDGIPLQYGSNIIPVDEELNKIDTGINLTEFDTSFGSALVQGITSGLTCVFNTVALKLMKETNPEFMIMHDWWLYLTATCYGKVYYDNNSYVLYRQHGSNVCGARTSKMERIRYRIKHFDERRKSVCRQAQEFVKCNPDMPADNKKIAEMVGGAQHSFLKRLQVVFSKQIKRQRKFDNIFYKFLVLFGYM